MLIKLKINNNMEEYKKENWKPINGYEGLYEISDLGRVKNVKRNKILKNWKSNRGYMRIVLRKNLKSYPYSIHRLVALNFLENIENKPEVNHIDGNKENNCINNLEWCTKSENQLHRYNILKNTNTKAKKIYKYDLKYNLIDEYNSVSEAAIINKCSQSNISQCAIGTIKTAVGCKWKYELI